VIGPLGERHHGYVGEVWGLALALRLTARDKLGAVVGPCKPRVGGEQWIESSEAASSE
jgi:hypothetical protein